MFISKWNICIEFLNLFSPICVLWFGLLSHLVEQRNCFKFTEFQTGITYPPLPHRLPIFGSQNGLKCNFWIFSGGRQYKIFLQFYRKILHLLPHGRFKIYKMTRLSHQHYLCVTIFVLSKTNSRVENDNHHVNGSSSFLKFQLKFQILDWFYP